MRTIPKGKTIELVEELQVICGKKFTPDQFERLSEAFNSIDWSKACQIVRDFERQERFPPNVYGVIANRIEDQYNDERKCHIAKEKWDVSDINKASSEEFSLWQKIVDEAKLWISLGLSEYQAEFSHIRLLPPDGQKCRSWSMIVDYAVNTWNEFQLKVRNPTPQQRCALLQEILDICREEREKELKKRNVEAGKSEAKAA